MLVKNWIENVVSTLKWKRGFHSLTYKNTYVVFTYASKVSVASGKNLITRLVGRKIDVTIEKINMGYHAQSSKSIKIIRIVIQNYN